MNTYTILIDYANAWDEKIQVFETTITASSAKAAYDQARANIDNGVYAHALPKSKVTCLWPVTEQDRIDEKTVQTKNGTVSVVSAESYIYEPATERLIPMGTPESRTFQNTRPVSSYRLIDAKDAVIIGLHKLLTNPTSNQRANMNDLIQIGYARVRKSLAL